MSESAASDQNYYRDADGNIIGPDVFIDGKPHDGTPLRESQWKPGDGWPLPEAETTGFTVEHRLTIKATCPVDGTTDAYNCLVWARRIIAVEHILAAVEEVTRMPSFQEDITRDLAEKLRAEVETHGIHSGVYTTCRCSA